MKRAYSTYSPHVKRVAEEHGVSVEELCEFLQKNFNSVQAAGETPKDYIKSILFDVERQVMQGNALHLFLPGREFCDWLVSCVPRLEREHARSLQEFIGPRPGVLHFPTCSRLCSAVFEVAGETTMLNGDAGPDFGMLVASFSRGNSQNLGSLAVKLDDEARASECGMWYAKLIVGLGMYANCFPETVRCGLPEDLKHPAHHQHKASRTIGIAEKVRLTAHGSPLPHFRSGHFRLLSSERFTKKRFQSVFVSETFVNKAKAKTVLTLEQADSVPA